MPRSRSIDIQSERVLRRSALALTWPASWMAPPNSKSFSVSVVLPASGWEMMAKVRRRETSRARGERAGVVDRSFKSVAAHRLVGALNATKQAPRHVEPSGSARRARPRENSLLHSRPRFGIGAALPASRHTQDAGVAQG